MSDNYNGEERRTHVDWHLSKSVSMSVILLLLGNISTSLWWASGLNSDVNNLKSRPDLTERVIKLEAKVGEYGRVLNKFEKTLDKFDNTLDTIILKGKR